ncbi:MAG: hypothetical protein V3U65_12770 [Granulosicoccaceae bacterium]
MITQSSHFTTIGNKTGTTPHSGLITSVVALVLLSGCASTTQTLNPQTTVQTPAPQSSEASQYKEYSQRLTQAEIHALFVSSRLLVSEYTGADLNHVKLVFASDGEIGSEVLSETQRLIASQFTDSGFASHFLNAVMSNQEGTYAALFATELAQVMLSTTLLQNYLGGLPEDGAIKRAAVKALLIHELVHASDDVMYGIHENRKLNFRASFAQSATFEGHAQWLTRKLCQPAACSSGLDALDNFMFSRDNPPNQLTQPVQAVSRNVLEYSYVEGEHFMQKLAARPDGDRLIDQLLSNPPQDPIQILDPASYPNTQRENRNQYLLKAAGDVDHHWLEQPWVLVQTSPLKGVNLRAEPGKREAAIDGFTRLITSMVAAQLYNQETPKHTPIEIMLMQTDRKNTAALFAQTLHENTITLHTETDHFSESIGVQSSSPEISILLTSERLESNTVYHSVVSRSGKYVIQVAGFGNNANEFVEYSVAVLTNLYGASDYLNDQASL